MNIIHAIDQMQSMLKDLSPLLWSYKENLKKQGFTEEQAFTLARDYQKIMFEYKKDES